MNKITKIDFNKIYLFETSLIGEGTIIDFGTKIFLIIPCYNPIYEIKENEYISTLYSYFIFEDVDFYSLEHEYYISDNKEFSGIKSHSTHSFLENKISKNKVKFSNLGVTLGGIGWLNYVVRYNDFYILYKEFEVGYPNPDYDNLLSDRKINNFLCSFNKLALAAKIKEKLNFVTE
jgi:hypothetical protein